MSGRIDNTSPRALAECVAVIILTFFVVFGGTAISAIGPVLKQWQFPVLNPPPDLPHTNASDKVLFTVSPLSNPRYWRADAYDVYTGNTIWKQSSEEVSDYRLGDYVDPGVEIYAGKRECNYTITVTERVGGDHIPTALNAAKLYNVTGSRKFGINAYSSYYTYEQVKSYSFTVVQFNYTREMLMKADVTSRSAASEYYDLPSTVPDRVKTLALNKTQGAKSPYEKAMLLASFLKSNEFKYIRYIEPPGNVDLVDWFLFNSKQGNCVEYASAFVVLARCSDIPARYVTGYALGQLEDGKRVVRNTHAHSWVEVWFRQVGWLAFEVTGSNYADPGDVSPKIDGIDQSIIGGGTGGGTGTTRPGKPDLTFTDEFRFSADRFIKEKKYKIFATVKNIGNGSAPPTLVRFHESNGIQTPVIDSEHIPALTMEGEYMLSINWTPALSGQIEIVGEIDPENAVTELDETNNNKSATVNVWNGPDLNLMASNVRFIPPQLVENDTAKIEMTIRNDGNVPISGGRVFVYDNGIRIGLEMNFSVGKFDTTTLFFTWSVVSPGNHVVNITTMPYYGVKDLDWSNNNITLSVPVSSNLEITQVVWDDVNGDLQFGKGDTVTVSVKNNMKRGVNVRVVLIYIAIERDVATYLNPGQVSNVVFILDFGVIEVTENAQIRVYSY